MVFCKKISHHFQKPYVNSILFTVSVRNMSNGRSFAVKNITQKKVFHRRVIRTTKFFSLLQKMRCFSIKTKSTFNFRYTIEKSTLYPTKIIIYHVFSFLFWCEKELIANRKWCCSMVKLQGLRDVWVLDFFSFSDSFWKNMFGTKFVLQTFLFPTKKKFRWLSSQEDVRRLLYRILFKDGK